jgi:hypothetical protein
VAAVPDAKSYSAFWGLLVALADVLWLTPLQKRLREHASRIQEGFDCDVLTLPWNDIKVGRQEDHEFVREQANKYEKIASRFPSIDNWYAPVVGILPIEVARIICQRSNCWWDSNQRRKYANLIIGSLTIIVLCVLGLGLIGGLTVEKLFLAVISPLSPAIILGIRQYSEHREAAGRLDKLKEHAEKLWLAALATPRNTDLSIKSRVLQDEIFENRKRSPLVLDWLYRHLRDDYEAQMNYGAEQLVAEAQERLGLSGNPSL